MKSKTYIVLEERHYAMNTYHYPNGWSLNIAKIDGDLCIGLLSKCEVWKEKLNMTSILLDHHETDHFFRIAEVIEDDVCFESWAYGQNWDGCPNPDGDDHEINISWIQNKIYKNDGLLPIDSSDGKLILVDLSSNGKNNI